ncbi:unnamed protein product [Rhodiola kirilowii]
MDAEARLEVIDLDLNEEPVQPSRSYQEMASDMETVYTRIEERIRRLEAVTLRARQRHERRLAREAVNEEAMSLNGESQHAVGNDLTSEAFNFNPALERREDGLKRSNSHLLALALELDVDAQVKKNSGEAFFDCNICLRKARDPVLTCCGHLYCWPCFYQLPDVGMDTKECPACKGEVKDTGIIPIYGSSDKALKRDGNKSGVEIPPRPQAHRIESIRQQRITRGSHSLRIDEVLRGLHSFSTLSSNLSSALSSAERIIEDLEGMAHMYPPAGQRYRVVFETHTNSNIVIPEAPDTNADTDTSLPSSFTSSVANGTTSAGNAVPPDPVASLRRRISPRREIHSQGHFTDVSVRVPRRSGLRSRTEGQEQLQSILMGRTEQQAPLLQQLSQSQDAPPHIGIPELLPVRVVNADSSNAHNSHETFPETNITAVPSSSRRRSDVLNTSEAGTPVPRRRRL